MALLSEWADSHMLREFFDAIVDKDIGAASTWLPGIREGAASGDPYCHEALGAFALEIDDDRSQAYEHLKVAADAGIPSAQRGLGHLLMEGDHKDHTAAAALFHKAALQGDPFAQYNLAGMYLRGDGVAQSDDEGLRFLDMAARGGVSEAAIQLADIRLTQEDFAGARRALERHIQLSDDLPPASALNLAAMCYQGVGGPVDKIKAMGSSLKAAQLGDRDTGLGYARTVLDELKLTKDDIRQAIEWAHVGDWAQSLTR
ncbi:tetratricopeptide repeat protein [Streptomyces sp. SGAir0957]